MAVDTQPSPGSGTENCVLNVHDPPPPYPSQERSSHLSGTRSNRQSHAHRIQVVLGHGSGQDTPICLEEGANRYHMPSVASSAPSLTQTLLSLFQATGDEDEDTPGEARTNDFQRRNRGIFTLAAWKWYFRPLVRSAYYKPLFHLLVLNFPYALAAWLYLFIFTVAGTTLLMALPLGAVLCFLDLLGARAFARGELALQSSFHSPLAYPPPYPPRPIFTRSRPPTPTELESGLTAVPEASFYKNTYSMFTDPTTYQALFYFIVVKSSITIILSLCLLIFVPPSFVLILPAPAVLRAVRKLGAWQANVAIEGLYIAVR
ncbi:hypothetical protein F5887DRAFT_1066133 [Amanita rubescens]|nr:hypothetical protein F5887DRAFT_1066133 [Amanita rubescens]